MKKSFQNNLIKIISQNVMYFNLDCILYRFKIEKTKKLWI